MTESFSIFFAILGVIILIILGIMAFAFLKDIIFGVVVLLIGIALIYGGLQLLIKEGGGAGALGIFLALIGGLITFFGGFVIKDGIKDLPNK